MNLVMVYKNYVVGMRLKTAQSLLATVRKVVCEFSPGFLKPLKGCCLGLQKLYRVSMSVQHLIRQVLSTKHVYAGKGQPFACKPDEHTNVHALTGWPASSVCVCALARYACAVRLRICIPSTTHACTASSGRDGQTL